MKKKLTSLTLALGLTASFTLPALAQDTNAPAEMQPQAASSDADQSSGNEMADIAKKLNNPVASLISVPFQNNVDFKIGPNNGTQYKLNIQPVIPISISENWNVISRTILPYIYQHDVIGTTTQSGLGDTTESLFFSPKKPAFGSLIWGVGPDLYIPTATESLLGAEKWGAGPTAVALVQTHGFTYGALMNHIWSFAGNSGRANISSTYMQPFLSYTTKTYTSVTLNTESTYNWENYQWTVPINLMLTQVIKIGHQPISLQVGGRYYAQRPAGGPTWGLRLNITLIFPKG
jgi:hypothetical protein